MTKNICWHNDIRKLSELKPAIYNPRRWSDQAIKQLTQSIEKFDLADPLIINTNNTIIGGHFRYKILRDKGVLEAEVRVPDRLLDEAEEKELNIRLNKNLGEFDFDLLSDFGEDILKDIGFDSKELDKIFQLSIDKQDEKTNTKTFICDECGEEFGSCHIYNKEIKLPKYRKKEGRWKKYYGANWCSQAELARERDKHTCQICGITETELCKSLDVHHKQPFREFGIENYQQANELNNLTSLCPSCHSSIEPRRRKGLYYYFEKSHTAFIENPQNFPS